MSVRSPQSLHRPVSADSAVNLLEYELMSERADALGRHGLRVEKAIAALAVLESGTVSPQQRDDLLNKAADEVWAFFIQRELCGLRNNRDAIERYGIPKPVIARLGVVRKS